MKILAVSDVESKIYYDYYKPGMLKDYDLILGCGDLNRAYLEFLVTMAHCPVVYVPGNHDDRFDREPPEGCISADGRIVTVNGVRILGLGGSHQYRKGSNMYTESQMRMRIRKLWWPLLRHRGFDILLTHAPARHINDLDTETHKGFECFRTLMEKYHPRFFLHGHVHLNYGMAISRTAEYEGTKVINAYEYYTFEYPDR